MCRAATGSCALMGELGRQGSLASMTATGRGDLGALALGGHRQVLGGAPIAAFSGERRDEAASAVLSSLATIAGRDRAGTAEHRHRPAGWRALNREREALRRLSVIAQLQIDRGWWWPGAAP